MEDVDLLICGGEVVTASGRRKAHVSVRQGKIAGLLDTRAPLPRSTKVVQADGLYVLPGAIDPHTHIGGGSKVLGSVGAAVRACTRALALGGTTTVMEMIAPERGMTLQQGLAQARAERAGNMTIDFAFHPSLPSVEDHVLSDLERCAEEGTPSFHASFEGSRGREPLNDGGLYRLLSAARERRMLAVLHAEDPRINEEMIRRTGASNRIENASRCRPWFSETAAVRRSLFVSQITRGPLYFEHLGAGPSLDLVREARREGLPAYAETCPHYLCFSEEIYGSARGPEFLKSPPLRRREDAEALWQGIRDGSICSVATDESMALVEKKRKLLEELPAYKVSGGLNQIELRLSVMHTEMVVKRGMSLERLVHLLATGPAILFGLYPRKGTIEVGSDADLVLFDPGIVKKVRNEELHQETDYTIFEGWEIHGAPRATFLRGNPLVEDGCLVASGCAGEWLPRAIDQDVIGGIPL